MKLLVVASSLDLSTPFGCTPAWWQLLKALAEQGTDIVAVPYHGPPVDSLWWRAERNPGYRYGQGYEAFRRHIRPRRLQTHANRRDAATLELRVVQRLVTPRWKDHLLSILEREGDVEAVVVLTAPLNHLVGIPSAIRRRFDIPVCYYDGDLPSSLPRHGGFGWGFDMYHGADLSEYDLVLSNSLGAVDELLAFGARRAEVLWWGADTDVFRPRTAVEDIDVLFYGVGVEHRQEWLRELITVPSQRLPQRRFVVAGRNLDLDFGAAERLGVIPPSQLGALVARSRIQLNVSRSSHAECYASATTRLFEVASMERAVVTRPIEGLSEWFETGKEVAVVHSADEAVDTYERLLADDAYRLDMGRAARRRVIADHTYQHRAVQLLGYLSSEVGRVTDRRTAPRNRAGDHATESATSAASATPKSSGYSRNGS